MYEELFENDTTDIHHMVEEEIENDDWEHFREVFFDFEDSLVDHEGDLPEEEGYVETGVKPVPGG